MSLMMDLKRRLHPPHGRIVEVNGWRALDFLFVLFVYSIFILVFSKDVVSWTALLKLVLPAATISQLTGTVLDLSCVLC